QFNLPSGQSFTQGWSANWNPSGTSMSATNMSWNANVPTGAAVDIGFNGRWSGSFSVPTTFQVNGVTCNGGTPTTTSQPPTTTTTTTSQPPTTTTTTTSQPPTTTTSVPPGQKVDNPYEGADGYVNPQWRAKALAEPGGDRIANQSTGVWLDTIKAIYGDPNSVSGGAMGLEAHLEEALQQDAANGSRPLYIQVVIYNLPGRDCSALASNGERGPDELPRYKAEYIDPIRDIMAQPRFANLRIITIIEIDSLPNLVTNLNVPMCQTVNANGAYVRGVGYALAQLGSLPNVYNYIDAAHHAWIGWDSNFGPTAQKLREAASAEGSTPAMVHGFITNTANYSALTEPYIDINGNINGQQIRQASWFDWNPYKDELSFAQAFRNRLVAEGFSPNIGMLIDTSRNGWGN